VLWNLWPRRRRVGVRRYDDAEAQWIPADTAHDISRAGLSVSTFNIWFDPYFAAERYQAIANLLAADPPDVMVFQEVTNEALAVFLVQPWIRQHYLSAAITSRRVGTYGMLLLSRVPVSGVTYTRLPTRMRRGFLRADLPINGMRTVICSAHLDSGKRSAPLRAQQLRRIFKALTRDDDVIVLGDFNMRDKENHRIDAPFSDVWPALRPDDDGFTEDTSINYMRYDSTQKERFVRFDRILLKGWRWQAESIELLGTQPISADNPRVFPSDHFGVRCHLTDTTSPRTRLV
jgi:tyrosyl-DNA phosphodiesterase 2